MTGQANPDAETGKYGTSLTGIGRTGKQAQKWLICVRIADTVSASAIRAYSAVGVRVKNGALPPGAGRTALGHGHGLSAALVAPLSGGKNACRPVR